ncbi:MAG: DegV family protein [Ruminococcaceae bacterium]|nr:DegV family protein [Oscillospiraceae bacterium]
MKKIKIIADSTCDLSEDIIKKYDISIVPLCILLDGKSYFDGLEITPDEIFRWSDENKTTPKTAAITFEKTLEVFKPFMDNGDDIIFFGISSHMSSTCNVPRILGAQEDYDRIFVIDSENLSTGIGLQVIKAAELAFEGRTAEEIVDMINADRAKVRASFVVDTLTFLARGGRCTAITAIMANTLKLHPMIIVKDGKMGVGKKYRGRMSVALSAYVDDLSSQLVNADSKRVFITHSGCEQAIIDLVKEKIEALGYFEEILITQAGGVISSHCGPNTLGVLFYTK